MSGQQLCPVCSCVRSAVVSGLQLCPVSRCVRSVFVFCYIVRSASGCLLTVCASSQCLSSVGVCVQSVFVSCRCVSSQSPDGVCVQSVFVSCRFCVSESSTDGVCLRFGVFGSWCVVAFRSLRQMESSTDGVCLRFGVSYRGCVSVLRRFRQMVCICVSKSSTDGVSCVGNARQVAADGGGRAEAAREVRAGQSGGSTTAAAVATWAGPRCCAAGRTKKTVSRSFEGGGEGRPDGGELVLCLEIGVRVADPHAQTPRRR